MKNLCAFEKWVYFLKNKKNTHTKKMKYRYKVSNDVI